MATSKEDMQKTNLNYRRYEEGDDTWSSMNDLIFNEDRTHKCPTYVHRTPPCQSSCPSGHDVRGWLDIVRGIEKPAGDMSMTEYAFQRTTMSNPFPAMMGRVCPAPCEDGCNRNDVDDFVGINAVEHFIGNTAFEEKYEFKDLPELTGKKVAIVGGGVAGMSAAYHLRRMGIASMIFDDHAYLGGMMRYGIPGYRTPRDIMEHECQRILDMGGVETTLNTRVGKDIAMADLEKEYDAILWALGCKKGRGLFLDDWNDTPNCVTAVDFLEQFNKGDMKYTANKIICVGGGDTSIDVVSVSRRIGTLKNFSENPEDSANGVITHGDVADADKKPCDSVVLTALFKQEDMTAAEHEVNDALIEGVTFFNEVMPVEIIKDDNGRATALKFVDCTFENNAPVAVEGGKEHIIECDLIVSAIGQFGDLEGLEDLDNGRSLIDADKYYQVPGKPGHFVAGDIVRPHLLTTAIGQGSVVAESINHYLKQEDQKKRPKVDVHHFNLLSKLDETGLNPSEYTGKYINTDDQRGTDSSDYAIHNYEDRSKHEIIKSSALFLGHFKAEARYLRPEDVPSSDDVLGHFEERMKSLEEEGAVAEATRCMSCGMCFECDNCVIYCPQDAVFRVKKDQSTLGRYVDTDYDKCIGCHICADVCPTGYINMGMGE